MINGYYTINNTYIARAFASAGSQVDLNDIEYNYFVNEVYPLLGKKEIFVSTDSFSASGVYFNSAEKIVQITFAEPITNFSLIVIFDADITHERYAFMLWGRSA